MDFITSAKFEWPNESNESNESDISDISFRSVLSVNNNCKHLLPFDVFSNRLVSVCIGCIACIDGIEGIGGIDGPAQMAHIIYRNIFC